MNFETIVDLGTDMAICCRCEALTPEEWVIVDEDGLEFCDENCYDDAMQDRYPMRADR